MGRKGRRSEAQKIRWRKLDLSEPETPCQSSFEQNGSSLINQVNEVHLPNAAPMHQRGNTCLQATHSQNDLMYGDNRNKQCTCNSLVFLATLHYRTKLNTDDLDYVLQKGNVMYSEVQARLRSRSGPNVPVPSHLAFDELPGNVEIYGQMYHIEKCPARFGYFRQDGPDDVPDFLRLSERLQCLSTDVQFALLTVGCLTIGLFKDNHTESYGIFDPHSRTSEGFYAEHGTALMLTFVHLNDLIDRIFAFWAQFETSDQWTYEFLPLKLTPTFECNEPVQPTEVQAHVVSENSQIKKYPKDRRKRKAARDENETIHEKKRMRKHYEKNRMDVLQYKRNKRAEYIQNNKQSTMQMRYSREPEFRSRQKRYSQVRYSSDPHFRDRKKRYSQVRYSSNPEQKKKYIQHRYLHNINFRSRHKLKMKHHYANSPTYRQKKKQNFNDRYKNDAAFRQYYLLSKRGSKNRRITYEKILHKMGCSLNIRRKYRNYSLARLFANLPEPEIEQQPIGLSTPLLDAIAAFRTEIQNGPTFICTVCHRALFYNQVKKCNRACYRKNRNMVERCLTGKYVHTCNQCNSSEICCAPEQKIEWICHSCHQNLKTGKMPAIAAINMLELTDIPPELKNMNILERHIIAKYIPFSKIISLPMGQQKLIHGGVVCVPSEVESTVNALPRPSSQSQILKVKLKRKMNYTGHYQFQTVNMSKVLCALSKLKEIHPEYRDININDMPAFETSGMADENDIDDDVTDTETDDLMETDAINESDLTDPAQETSSASANNEQNESNDDQESSEQNTNQQTGMIDSCLQPADLAQEMLTFGEGIFSVAPAQGNRPVSFFQIPKLEAMAFPVQFPTGENTLDETQRPRKVSPSRYFNARLFCIDNRFALDSNYIFFAQFITEMHMAKSSMSIQLRKGKPMTRDGRKITARMLRDKREVEKLVHNRDATRFMRPLRGTPAYWEKTLRDLYAMLRTLGCPTFFLTFSAAEMRWPEVIQTIQAQKGEHVEFSELDWASKCEILRSNPVTTMRMFNKRVDALMRNLILSPCQPIGEVVDYFYRVEFQARGSPHIHALVWCKNAPVFEEDPDEKVCEFVDKYITCQLPDPETDPELFKIVKEVQTHSKSHSKSCKKGNKHCRFGFPKQPVENTFITRPRPVEIMNESDDESEANDNPSMSPEDAKNKLKPVWELLNNPTSSFENMSQLLAHCNLTYEEYLNCVESLTTASVLVMKRKPQECWVNVYNPVLLRAWSANMDIQFVLNPYSCMMYILSYISKAEHEMSEYLKTVVSDTSQSTTSDSEEMKQIMQAYSKNREVSVQEAVARVCSIPLKKSSRSVIFIPTDDDAVKMSVPLRYLNDRTPESENVWMSGLGEKYKNRPDTPEFSIMCMAEFASTYRIAYGRQKESSQVLPLLHEMGFIQKRTTGKPAIIRYARFSVKKAPEKFYGTLLKLYLPHRSNAELKPTGFTYESFYASGCVRLPGKYCTERVSAIVTEHRSVYEKNSDDIDKAIANLEENGPIEDAWTNLAPETELQRLECVSEREHINPEEMNEQDDIPEYSASTSRGGVAPMFEAPQTDPNVIRGMYQNLNQTQASIFYTVRKWCIRRVCGQNADQFFYFVTGGAGTGKSHLIKCIYAEASKILRRLPHITEERDMSMPSVLITAFTGTAAFNISGLTLHAVLKLPRSLKPPYQCLGNCRDEVRATLSNVQIIIIDEVSMVSKQLFAYVNWRLQEIKGCKRPFGGISIMVFGDFFQLPAPGKAKPLCVYEDHVIDFWKDRFQIVTLTEIMRQKDDVPFAELLNRLRVKRKGESLTEADRALLSQAVCQPEDCPKDILHLFATNKEVKQHNTNTISALYSELVNVEAHDYRKDPQTGQMERMRAPFSGRKGELPDTLQIAIGAPVMLIRNIDVEDGLVNGSFGKIAKILYQVVDGKNHVNMVGIELDSPHAGQRHRNKVPGQADNLVYIDRIEEPLSKKGVKRLMLPLVLSFSSTIHKAQGMTRECAVVSLNRIFEPGMAYVALSRTTSLSGLRIINFDEQNIYSDPQITHSLENMPKAHFENAMPLLHCLPSVSAHSCLKLIHHNTEGLSAHIEDVKKHHEMCLADIICFTETHLFGTFVPDNIQLENYQMYKRNRHMSYSTIPHLAQRNGGGVAVYVKSHVQARQVPYIQGVTDLEFLVMKVLTPVPMLIAVIYRPPDFNTSQFLPNLCSLLDSLHIIADSPIIVCGDFNEDILISGRKPIYELFQSKGYTGLITTATTEKNTLLDNIYISDPQHCAHSGVMQTYYSYHDPVFCILT